MGSDTEVLLMRRLNSSSSPPAAVSDGPQKSSSEVFVFSTLLGILVVSLSLAWNVALQSIAFELLGHWSERGCRDLRSADAACDSAAAGIVTAIVAILVLLGMGARALGKCMCRSC
jgi:hypothetical protein